MFVLADLSDLAVLDDARTVRYCRSLSLSRTDAGLTSDLAVWSMVDFPIPASPLGHEIGDVLGSPVQLSISLNALSRVPCRATILLNGCARLQTKPRRLTIRLRFGVAWCCLIDPGVCIWSRSFPCTSTLSLATGHPTSASGECLNGYIGSHLV